MSKLLYIPTGEYIYSWMFRTVVDPDPLNLSDREIDYLFDLIKDGGYTINPAWLKKYNMRAPLYKEEFEIIKND